jgi:hypothetical protein
MEQLDAILFRLSEVTKQKAKLEEEIFKTREALEKVLKELGRTKHENKYGKVTIIEKNKKTFNESLFRERSPHLYELGLVQKLDLKQLEKQLIATYIQEQDLTIEEAVALTKEVLGQYEEIEKTTQELRFSISKNGDI